MKTLKKKKDRRMFLGSYLTAKGCPKCGTKLYHDVASGLTLYSCKKCGYIGPVGINPLEKGSKKKFEKAVKDMKQFMKSRKK